MLPVASCKSARGKKVRGTSCRTDHERRGAGSFPNGGKYVAVWKRINSEATQTNRWCLGVEYPRMVERRHDDFSGRSEPVSLFAWDEETAGSIPAARIICGVGVMANT